jgi:Domain of unknown function (DUF4913)
MTDTLNTDTEPTSAAAEVTPQMDLGELLESAVRKAVTAQLAAQAKDLAAGVVEAMLTPEVRAGMRETAILEAQIALNPIPEPAPEPEPEPEPQAEEDEAETPERELLYPTVGAFVEGYVAKLYKREVTVEGSEKTFRWCPRWHAHGEVWARMNALWRAFEHLRLGENTELSSFWLMHLDPHMAQILDPNGPFKYCTVRGGHKAKLAALATVAVPEGTDPDGYYTETPSGIFVPPARPNRRIHMEFPE